MSIVCAVQKVVVSSNIPQKRSYLPFCEASRSTMGSEPHYIRLKNFFTYSEALGYLRKFGEVVDFNNEELSKKAKYIIHGEICKAFPAVQLENGSFNVVLLLKQANHQMSAAETFRIILQVQSLGALTGLNVGSFLSVFKPHPFKAWKMKAFSAGPKGVIVWYSNKRLPLTYKENNPADQVLQPQLQESGSSPCTLSHISRHMKVPFDEPPVQLQTTIANCSDDSEQSKDRLRMPPPPSARFDGNGRCGQQISTCSSKYIPRETCQVRHNCCSNHAPCQCISTLPAAHSSHQNPQYSHHYCPRNHSDTHLTGCQHCSPCYAPCQPSPCSSFGHDCQSRGSHGCTSFPSSYSSCCHHHNSSSKRFKRRDVDVNCKCSSKSYSPPHKKSRSGLPIKPLNQETPTSSQRNDWYIEQWVEQSKQAQCETTILPKDSIPLVSNPNLLSQSTQRATWGESSDWQFEDEESFSSISQVINRTLLNQAASSNHATMSCPQISAEMQSEILPAPDSESGSDDQSLSDTSTLFLNNSRPLLAKKAQKKTNSAPVAAAPENPSSDTSKGKSQEVAQYSGTNSNGNSEEPTAAASKSGERPSDDVENPPTTLPESRNERGGDKKRDCYESVDTQKTCSQPVIVDEELLAQVAKRPGGGGEFWRDTQDSEGPFFVPEKKVKLHNPKDSSWLFDPSNSAHHISIPSIKCAAADQPNSKNNEKESSGKAVPLTEPVDEAIIIDSQESMKSQGEQLEVHDKERLLNTVQSTSQESDVGIIPPSDAEKDNNALCELPPPIAETPATADNSKDEVVEHSANNEYLTETSQCKKHLPDVIHQLLEMLEDDNEGLINCSKDHESKGCQNVAVEDFHQIASETIDSHNILSKEILTAPPPSLDNSRISNDPSDNLNEEQEQTAAEDVGVNESYLLGQTVDMSLTLLGACETSKLSQELIASPQNCSKSHYETVESMPSSKGGVIENVPHGQLGQSERHPTCSQSLDLNLAITDFSSSNSAPAVGDHKGETVEKMISCVDRSIVGESNQFLRRSPDSTTDGLSDEIKRASPASTVFYDAENSNFIHNYVDGDAPNRNIVAHTGENNSQSSTAPGSSDCDVSKKLEVPDQIFQVEGTIVDIRPHTTVNGANAIIKGVCNVGCKNSFNHDVAVQSSRVKRFCRLCSVRWHHICPHCIKSGKKYALCFRFHFELHVAIGSFVLRLQVEGEEAEKFVGLTLRQYLSRGKAAQEAIRRLESLESSDVEQKKEYLKGHLCIKTELRSDQVVPLLVDTRLNDFKFSKN